MKGKQAAHAANQRYAAAMDHIGRLTDQLTEAKLRMRIAEEATRVANIRADNAEREMKANEALVAEAKEMRQWIFDTQAEIERRKAEGWKDLRRLVYNMFPDMPPFDRAELICRRYPALLLVLGCRVTDDKKAFIKGQHAERLSDEHARNLARIRGQRGAAEWDRDMDYVDVMMDVLDAREIGLSLDEITELFELKERPRQETVPPSEPE